MKEKPEVKMKEKTAAHPLAWPVCFALQKWRTAALAKWEKQENKWKGRKCRIRNKETILARLIKRRQKIW